MSDTTRPTREQIEALVLNMGTGSRKYSDPNEREVAIYLAQLASFCLALLDENANLRERLAESEARAFDRVEAQRAFDRILIGEIGDKCTELRSENANLKRHMGLIGAACIAGDINEAHHQFYMAVVKDLHLPPQEQSRIAQEAIDAAMESTASEGKA